MTYLDGHSSVWEETPKVYVSWLHENLRHSNNTSATIIAPLYPVMLEVFDGCPVVSWKSMLTGYNHHHSDYLYILRRTGSSNDSNEESSEDGGGNDDNSNNTTIIDSQV